MSDTLVEELKKLLHNTKANPHKIVLEIEDYMMYDKMDQVKLNLLRLRDLGFRISVDGLKLDYAALSQIEKEPIDIIKLDRSFLKDINNNKMKEKFVEMLVDSAEHMHRMVIAEGVEVYDHILYLEKIIFNMVKVIISQSLLKINLFMSSLLTRILKIN